MNTFPTIRHDAYRNYRAFDQINSRSDNYAIDLAKPEKCTFTTGTAQFTMLPVVTANEYVDQPSALVFGSDHPTGYIFPQLEEVVKRLNLPRNYITTYGDHRTDGATRCYRFGFKLAAVVCQDVGGKAFLNVCPKEGVWMWFVILQAENDAAKALLESLQEKKAKITNDDADKWYKMTKIE